MVEIDEKQAFAILQKAKESGKIRIGINEVTKAIERGQAKLVVTASDVSPAEIVAHIPGLCKEMKALSTSAGNKAELGAAVGIKNTSAVAVLDAGSAKKDLEELVKKSQEKKEAPKVEEVKEEAKVEETPEAPAKEEATEEKSEEAPTEEKKAE